MADAQTVDAAASLGIDDPVLRDRIEAELARRMDAHREELASRNAKMIEEELAKLRRQYGPPSTEEIQKLLDQEYVSFTVSLRADGSARTFTIQELPQAVEKKLYRIIKDNIVPRARDLGALSMNVLEGTAESKIKALFEAFDPSFDILAQAAVLILDPRGEDASITKDWVQDNVSSSRMWNIIEAQVAVNRVRDFFSRLFQTVPMDGRLT